jgi:hypothetical protein
MARRLPAGLYVGANVHRRDRKAATQGDGEQRIARPMFHRGWLLLNSHVDTGALQ